MNGSYKILVIALVMLLAANVFAAIPEITQATYTPSPAVPGSTFTYLVQVQNNDSSVQKGVIVSIEEQYPFTVKASETETNPRIIGDIGNYGKALVTFTVYVDPTAENQTYSLPVIVSTKDNPDGKKTNEEVVVAGKEPSLKVIGVSDEKLLPGEEKEVGLILQNVGTSPAYDVVIEIQEDRTVTATGTVIEREITPIGATSAYVTRVAPGEQKTATLKLAVSESASVKNYTLPIKISYRNTAGTRTTDTSYIGIRVFGAAEIDATLKERTGNLTAGQRNETTIEIFNKGLGQAQFVLVEISAKNGKVEKPKQFIGTLGPNDVDTVKTGIEFNTSGDQEVEVKITYQDSDATEKSTTITVPVKNSVGAAQGDNTGTIIIIAIIVIAGIWYFFFRKKKK